MNSQHYIGNELALFSKAENWKNYYGSFLKPYLKGRVLEVGAGLGSTTQHLCDGTQQQWLCLEPDAALAEQVAQHIAQGTLPACCSLKIGTLADIPASAQFEAIMYIDVIEHIEDDKAELRNACRHLAPGGVLMIIVPAHQWLYSPFDKAIGHYRRYNRKSLLSAIPEGVRLKKIAYLDSVGLLASTANKLMLKQSYPTEPQIRFWDTLMVPFSRITDTLTAYTLGKSLVGIWQKP